MYMVEHSIILTQHTINLKMMRGLQHILTVLLQNLRKDEPVRDFPVSEYLDSL